MYFHFFLCQLWVLDSLLPHKYPHVPWIPHKRCILITNMVFFKIGNNLWRYDQHKRIHGTISACLWLLPSETTNLPVRHPLHS